MRAVYLGDKVEMTPAKQRVIEAAKQADHIEYHTIVGLSVATLYFKENKLITVIGAFWSFVKK